MTLDTGRLRLEPLAPVHAEALCAIWGDPEVARLLISRPASRAECEALFERNLAAGRRLGMWAALERASGRTLGRIGFFAFGETARPELAFLLARDAWGRGLATEAARAVLRFGFSTRGISECVALVRPANGGALRVLEKLGMTREARLELAGGAADLYRVDAAGFEAALGAASAG